MLVLKVCSDSDKFTFLLARWLIQVLESQIKEYTKNKREYFSFFSRRRVKISSLNLKKRSLNNHKILVFGNGLLVVVIVLKGHEKKIYFLKIVGNVFRNVLLVFVSWDLRGSLVERRYLSWSIVDGLDLFIYFVL